MEVKMKIRIKTRAKFYDDEGGMKSDRRTQTRTA